ncbi:MAG TPA: amidohydrolase family protein [Steroidobacteraceae bacterium]|nr:amidohydrolase family protein [Steroidobacteraceae bacterium]
MLALINTDVAGERTTVKVVGSRIAAIGEPPAGHERVLELAGDRLLPGLINAHDHLQLNHLPRLEPAGRYRHVREWIAEVDGARRVEGALKAAVSVPRAERLLLGGVKNLLSGVTTVAHHDPLYPGLCELQYPVRVVARYGWAHSLYIEGEAKTTESQRRTPADWPWIIHAAEGVDEEAREEFWQLDRLGCLKPNTLLVHGVALGAPERRRLSAASAGLIWCPSSNLHLFGVTADVAELIGQGQVALGTDSRLTGGRDLLAELRTAAAQVVMSPGVLESMVTRDAAKLLRLAGCGVIAPQARADLMIVPAAMPLERVRRSDIRLVMVDGVALYADPDIARALGPAGHWAEVCVDGRVKVLAAALVERLRHLALCEPGLELAAVTGRAA